MESALEKIGYSQYYDEVSYIANVYWGWKLPDLTKYKDQINKRLSNDSKYMELDKSRL